MCPIRYIKVLKTYMLRLIDGFFDIRIPKIMLKIVRAEKGMINIAPASVYEILNLFTKRSFKLSKKPAKHD